MVTRFFISRVIKEGGSNLALELLAQSLREAIYDEMYETIEI